MLVLTLTVLSSEAPSDEYVDSWIDRKIKVNTPYLLMDDYFIDNRFNEDQISARVPHVLQRGERTSSPLMTYDPNHPWEKHGVGYVSVMFDSKMKKFRLYYQIWNPRVDEPGHPQRRFCRNRYRRCVCTAAD